MKFPTPAVLPVLCSRVASPRGFLPAAFLCAVWLALLCAPRTAHAQPANDLFAEALAIAGDAGGLSTSSLGATEEAGEPNHAGNVGGSSIWFAWTAPSNGVAIFDTLDSGFDTLLAAYSGTTLANLAALANNDDAVAGTVFQSSIAFGVRAGVRYLIVVDGFNGEEGDVELHWRMDPPPANDSFARPLDISGAAGVSIGFNWGATKEPGEPNHAFNVGNASVWWRWTAPVSGIVTMNTANSVNTLNAFMDTLLGVYTGTNVSALTLVATNDNLSTASTRSRVTFNVVQGTTYRIVIDGADRTTNAFQGRAVLAWAISLPPTNNTFASGQNIQGACGTLSAHNTSCTKESGEPNHAGSAGGSSAWFNWTAPFDGPAVFTTSVSPFLDTLLAVYTGNAVNALTPIAANNNLAANNINSRVEFTATAGTTYRIAVDSASAAQYPFTLSWGVGAPAGNEFFDALAINTAGGSLQTCTFSATKAIGEPDHGGNAGGKSIWYAWTPPISGIALLDLGGSSFDTLLGVYTGTSVDALTLVVDNDDFNGTQQSRVVFPVQAGQTYYIAIDGFDAADGIVRLAWNISVPPVLSQLQDFVANVGQRFAVTNQATPGSVPASQLTYSLGPGAPSGARINPGTGVFSWTPAPEHAPSTNQITVIVSDNGTPTTSDSKSFNIFVNDFVEVTVGGAIIYAGQTGSVSLVGYSSASVTNLQFTVSFPPGRFTSVSAQPSAPFSVVSEVLLNENRVRLTFSDTLPFSGPLDLGKLTCTTTASEPSAFLPLVVTNAAAARSDGTLVPWIVSNNGRIVLIATQPLLEATLGMDQQRLLTLYGHTNTTYHVESTTNLAPPVIWSDSGPITLTSPSDTQPVLGPAATNLFFRVRE